VNRLLRLLLIAVILPLGACAHLSDVQRQQAHDYAQRAQSTVVDCPPGCELASPLRDLGDTAYAHSRVDAARHEVVLLDRGTDSLLARVHLIRSAKQTIDLQTFHFELDDAGTLVLDELMAAARRGVKVRLLLDQLGGLADPDLQARLASYHRNFELRVYNPVFKKAKVGSLQFAMAVVFKFRDINQRMHNKVMVVDGRVAVIGGRNIQDKYYDWEVDYNYRDRDLLVAGPVCVAMTANFEAFWTDRRAFPTAGLADVARVLIANKGPPAAEDDLRTPRAEAMRVAAEDSPAVFSRLSPFLLEVGRVDFFGDLPNKHDAALQSRSDASKALLDIIGGTRHELLLQTPYLVLSRPARRLFRYLHRQPDAPGVRVSTNSLAATDAFPVYAMSHKYKRLYLRELGFQIHEYKPFPLNAPIDPATTGALDAPAQALPPRKVDYDRNDGPVPLKRAGVRIGMHAKSMVIDERIGVVGSHNFDPRSSKLNTESMIVVHDATFAAALAASIRNDMAPENAWLIGKREELPLVAQLNYNLGKLSEKLPIFDLWPLPYATSYELQPGCQPVPEGDPTFYDCYKDVGDFPEVNMSLKSVYTRILTAFGAGLVPIL
jgi:cardiolipin synthase C